MNDIILVRDGPNLKAKITVLDANDNGVITGITVNFSIRRKSDDFYFDGASFTNTTEVQLVASHVLEGLYVLTLTGAYSNLEKLYEVRVEITGTETADFRIEQSLYEAYLDSLPSKYEGAIWFDAVSLNTNTILGVDGTPDNPVGDWTSASSLALLLGTKKIKVKGNLAVGSVSDHIFEIWNIGETFDQFSTTHAKVTIGAGVAITRCVFKGLEIEKNATGILTNNAFEKCMIKGLSTQGIEGVYRRCSFDGGTYDIAGDTLIYDAFTMRGAKIVFNMLPGIKNLKVFGLHFMDAEIINHATNQVTIIEILSGRLTVNASCTGGNINIIGDPKLINNTGGALVIKDFIGLQNWTGDDLLGTGASMIEDDGAGDKRWTQKALEETGGGGDATLANQNLILTNIGNIVTAIAALNDISPSDVLAKVNEALDAGNSAQPIPDVETGSLRDWIQLCASVLKLKKIETDSLQTIVKEDGSSTYGNRNISTSLTDVTTGELT